MTNLVIIDKPEVTVVDHCYHIYIDHSDPLAATGFFSEKYDPKTDDKFMKKLGSLVKEQKVKNRNASGDTERWLIQISKLNEKSLDKMSEFLGTKLNIKASKVDDRKVLFQNENITLLDYSAASIAIFVDKDPTGNISKILTEYSALVNSALTGPGMKKRLGYVFSKKSKKYDAFYDDLTTMRQTSLVTDDIPDEDGVETQPNSKDGFQQVLMWGGSDFLDEQLNGLNYELVEEREYANDRYRYLIKILDE